MGTKAYDEIIKTRVSTDGAYAIAFAILELAKAQNRLASNVQRLGNADAATPMGALEAFGAHMGEKLDAIALALSER